MTRPVKTLLISAILAPFVIVGTTFHQVNFFESGWESMEAGDCLMVFGSRTLPGDKPGLMMRERLATAAEFITEETEHVIVAGGTIDEEIKTESAVMKAELVEAGVPADKIVEETRSTSTYENLFFAKEQLKELGCERIDMVSHDFHLARIKMTAKSLDIPYHRLIPAQNARANTSARLGREHLAYLWYWLGWHWLADDASVEP